MAKKELIKVEILKAFYDKNKKDKLYEVGTIVEFTESRVKEINSTIKGLIKIVKENDSNKETESDKKENDSNKEIESDKNENDSNESENKEN